MYPTKEKLNKHPIKLIILNMGYVEIFCLMSASASN